MWSHCICCSADLGSNQDLEEFQIGGRLAFDSAKGRLWVVCPKCERWNLVPLDQRWEAVEALERLYSLTPTRYSTREVGLARLGGGLQIVRIGDPIPGEFAAWRWGSRFGRKRRLLNKARKKKKEEKKEGFIQLERGPRLAAGLALAPLAPFLVPMALVGGLGYLISRLDPDKPANAPDPFALSRWRLAGGGMTPSEVDPGWSFHVQIPKFVEVMGSDTWVWTWKEFVGEDAIRIGRRALPLLNRRTPKLVTVSDAVGEISRQGGVEGYLAHAAALKPKWVQFRHYPKPILLAMEMALFEEEERRAMEGELGRLAAAWREAEELAAISDNLIVPKGWKAFRAQVKAAGATPPGRPRPPDS